MAYAPGSTSLARRVGALAAALAWIASAACALAVAAPAWAQSPASGGGGLAPNHPPISAAPTPPSKHAKGTWYKGFTITEYWPAPESWFRGELVKAPGLSGKHRIDWLYSAEGVSMEGDGVGLDGRRYHIANMGNGGWVTASGKSTSASDEFSAGAPFWRAGGYWRNRSGGVTFPLQAGGWSAGPGRSYVPLPGVSFAAGPSLPLRYYRSIAVDPTMIPLGSRVYIPAYKHDGRGGWFIAQDTGGAINGRRIDVYRPPPASPSNGGDYLTSQRVFVVKSGR